MSSHKNFPNSLSRFCLLAGTAFALSATPSPAAPSTAASAPPSAAPSAAPPSAAPSSAQRFGGGVLSDATLRSYVAAFNAADNELYKQAFPNAAAAEFLSQNVPRFECPDKDLERTFYFRWWTLRKHIKKTARNGFVFSEFLPSVGWAGKENTISCASGHHFREARWLRDSRYLNDYGRFWLHGGGKLHAYTSWIADSLLQQARVTGDDSLARELLPTLIKNRDAWERERRDPNGLFWQNDGADGMEVSAAGAELKTTAHYRSTINSYLAADALAVAEIAARNGDAATAQRFRENAAKTLTLRDTLLWDVAANFYKVAPRAKKPSTRLRLAADREQHGYTPWYFENTFPPAERDNAWAQLADPQGFRAPYGPTTTERRSPRFQLSYKGHECQWNGPSWPYATSITLTALANLANVRDSAALRGLFLETLACYTRSHNLRREDGKTVPWIDENLNPLTGDWISRTRLKTWAKGTWSAGKGGVERGKDYNHSTFCDLVITGVAGLRPAEGKQFVVNPIIPAEWDWFCLDNTSYHGRTLTILYDKAGAKYGKGAGLFIFADGKQIAHSPRLSRLVCEL